MAFAPANPPPAPPIPVDLIVSKSPVDVAGRRITVGDADGNLLYKSQPLSRPRSATVPHQSYRVLLDAADNPLVTLIRSPGGWQGFRGNSNCLIFRVQSNLHSSMRAELEVFLVGENWSDLTSDFTIRGSPLQRYCTICKGDTIMAQTTALYKLGKVVVGRHKFRLTIYPGRDQILIIALLVVFFDGVY